MKKFGSIVWGILLIIIGVIFGLNALDITDIDIFFDGWWTLFIMIPCLFGLVQDHDKTGSIIGILIGVLLLLACQDVVSFQIVWKLMIPTILVIIGLSIVFKDVFANKVRREIKKLGKQSDKDYCATFSEQNLNFDNEEFTGCELTAVFGGVKCDLRDAVIKEDVVITTSSIFGGIDIYVPKDVKVKVSSNSIFGGVDNKYKNGKDEKAVTIYINATCIFGGVEIR